MGFYNNFLEIPKNKYQVIFANPFSILKEEEKKTISNTKENKKLISSTNKEYSLHYIHDIEKLKIRNISSNDCILFLWCNPSNLIGAFRVITKWGFESYQGNILWVKTDQTSKLLESQQTVFVKGKKEIIKQSRIGIFSQNITEILLIATKGNIIQSIQNKLDKKKSSNIFFEQVKKDMIKPYEIIKLVENLFNNHKKIELYSNDNRINWDFFGIEQKKKTDITSFFMSKKDINTSTSGIVLSSSKPSGSSNKKENNDLYDEESDGEIEEKSIDNSIENKEIDMDEEEEEEKKDENTDSETGKYPLIYLTPEWDILFSELDNQLIDDWILPDQIFKEKFYKTRLGKVSYQEDLTELENNLVKEKNGENLTQKQSQINKLHRRNKQVFDKVKKLFNVKKYLEEDGFLFVLVNEKHLMNVIKFISYCGILYKNIFKFWIKVNNTKENKVEFPNNKDNVLFNTNNMEYILVFGNSRNSKYIKPIKKAKKSDEDSTLNKQNSSDYRKISSSILLHPENEVITDLIKKIRDEIDDEDYDENSTRKEPYYCSTIILKQIMKIFKNIPRKHLFCNNNEDEIKDNTKHGWDCLSFNYKDMDFLKYEEIEINKDVIEKQIEIFNQIHEENTTKLNKLRERKNANSKKRRLEKKKRREERMKAKKERREEEAKSKKNKINPPDFLEDFDSSGDEDYEQNSSDDDEDDEEEEEENEDYE
jgi:N6-adenosine-specific RNA methylase IME4